MPGLIRAMYEKRDLITRIMLIPAAGHAPAPRKSDIESSTIEDVEHMMAEVFPGLEFVPVGVLSPHEAHHAGVFGFKGISWAASHPNCECFAPDDRQPAATGVTRPSRST